MDDKKKLRNPGKAWLQVAGTICILLLAAILLWNGNANSAQSVPAMMAQVQFVGEYRIADGPWQDIVEGAHIPATKGDVTLRGNFHISTPSGEHIGIYAGETPIAFYMDHINMTFFEVGMEPVSLDTENPLYGNSVCGESWTAHIITTEEPLEIRIHNPHSYGNETAIDDMLSSTAFWADMEFEKTVLKSGDGQRNAGLFFLVFAVLLLGIALFSTLIHIHNNKLLWLFGLVVLFAATYFIYSADGIYFWNDSVVSNTTIVGFSMMFYMLFSAMVIAYFLQTSQKLAAITLTCLGVADAVLLVLPMVTSLCFYDTWVYWVALQLVANLFLMVCLVRECICGDKKYRWLCIGAMLPLIAFAADSIMTGIGLWKGGLASKYVFVGLFVVAMVVVLRIVPRGINAAAKAKELETEKTALHAQLTETRVSTMMSQIRPHFIYNTLGSIEQLCQIDPEKAGELVHNFAKYLRGNFGELDNPRPIQLSQEMEHVQYYISIEKVRFPDMTFLFETDTVDFRLPALTIQPIVENAVKHGLMKRDKGGTIRVVTYETDSCYCVSVEDDGAGFDTGVLQEDRVHMGIRNIRERLKAMVDGTITIESTVGVGTKVLISIPKEVQA